MRTTAFLRQTSHIVESTLLVISSLTTPCLSFLKIHIEVNLTMSFCKVTFRLMICKFQFLLLFAVQPMKHNLSWYNFLNQGA